MTLKGGFPPRPAHQPDVDDLRKYIKDVLAPLESLLRDEFSMSFGYHLTSLLEGLVKTRPYAKGNRVRVVEDPWANESYVAVGNTGVVHACSFGPSGWVVVLTMDDESRTSWISGRPELVPLSDRHVWTFAVHRVVLHDGPPVVSDYSTAMRFGCIPGAEGE